MSGTSLAGDVGSGGPAVHSCLCTLRFIKEQKKVPFGLPCVLLISM